MTKSEAIRARSEDIKARILAHIEIQPSSISEMYQALKPNMSREGFRNHVKELSEGAKIHTKTTWLGKGMGNITRWHLGPPIDVETSYPHPEPILPALAIALGYRIMPEVTGGKIVRDGNRQQ